jgi:hypothetical protein
MCTDAAEKELSFTFTGKACSVYFYGGSVRNIEFSVDGSDWEKVISDGNRPLTLLFDERKTAERNIRMRFCRSEIVFDFKIIGILVWYE